VVIDLGPAGVARCIEEAGIGFCFAPRYHPAMRHAVPVRRELGVPTAFNFLGPLANPARVRRQVLGVGDPAMAPKMARVLAAGGATRALVVHGADGLDELSTTGPSTLYDWKGEAGSVLDTDPEGCGPRGELRSLTVDPRDLGLAPAKVNDLLGGDAATNGTFARRVLAGEPGPHRDIVLLNAAAGLVAAGRSDDLEAGLGEAAAAVDEGRAEAALDRLVAVSADEARRGRRPD
jgi:anthranilate phosphoribosyltransferase